MPWGWWVPESLQVCFDFVIHFQLLLLVPIVPTQLLVLRSIVLMQKDDLTSDPRAHPG